MRIESNYEGVIARRLFESEREKLRQMNDAKRRAWLRAKLALLGAKDFEVDAVVLEIEKRLRDEAGPADDTPEPRDDDWMYESVRR